MWGSRQNKNTNQPYQDKFTQSKRWGADGEILRMTLSAKQYSNTLHSNNKPQQSIDWGVSTRQTQDEES